MIIGIDCGCLGIRNENSKGGIYNIAKILLESLGKLDEENSYILYSFYPIDKKLMQSFGKRMKNVVVNPAKGWMSLWLPLRINKDKPSVFIGVSQATPRKLPFLYYPYAITMMYDIAFEKFPKMYAGFPRKLRKNSRYAASKSDLLIVASDNSKKDIIDLYNVESSKVKTIYPAISKIFTDKGDRQKFSNPYFLFVGAFKKTKNLLLVIKSFHSFLDKTKLTYDLVLVGGGELSREMKDVMKNKHSLRIKLMGFVDDITLSKLYRGAAAFVSPSFYEGFGLPFLEAMSCGCPVIASTGGSIPEVVSKAAILIDPNDQRSLTSAMLKVLDNKKREKMKSDGLKRARDFSPDKFGKEVLKLINSIHE